VFHLQSNYKTRQKVIVRLDKIEGNTQTKYLNLIIRQTVIKNVICGETIK
jgi:hypothetical protein